MQLLLILQLSHWFLSACVLSADSYSAAGSEGSISTSVASLPPQPSGSSAPSSPSSRRSVSALTKWLTNPVRKLSAGSTVKGDRQVRKLEGKTPPLSSQSQNQSQDLFSPVRPDEAFTILPVTHREQVRTSSITYHQDVFFNLWSHELVRQVLSLQSGFYLRQVTWSSS